MTARDTLIGILQQWTERNGAATQTPDALVAAADDELLRHHAEKIGEIGTAKGWSTWAAAYLHPDVEFVDADMPSTETIVAALRRLDRAAVLRETAAFYDRVLKDMGAETECDPRYWIAVRDVATGLRRRADDVERGKDTSGGSHLREGESTPDFFEPDHTYQRGRWQFQCLAVAPAPFWGGDVRAVGYLTRQDGTGSVVGLDPEDWAHGTWRETSRGDS